MSTRNDTADEMWVRDYPGEEIVEEKKVVTTVVEERHPVNYN
jgi:hypothetical protein